MTGLEPDWGISGARQEAGPGWKKEVIPPPTLPFLATMRWASVLHLMLPSICHHSPETTEPSSHGLKPPKPNIFPSLSQLSLVCSHNHGKLVDTKALGIPYFSHHPFPKTDTVNWSFELRQWNWPLGTRPRILYHSRSATDAHW